MRQFVTRYHTDVVHGVMLSYHITIIMISLHWDAVIDHRMLPWVVGGWQRRGLDGAGGKLGTRYFPSVE